MSSASEIRIVVGEKTMTENWSLGASVQEPRLLRSLRSWFAGMKPAEPLEASVRGARESGAPEAGVVESVVAVGGFAAKASLGTGSIETPSSSPCFSGEPGLAYTPSRLISAVDLP